MHWQTKSFIQLSTLELFDYLKLRQSVFVVEQTCPYPDIDDVDKKSDHLLGYDVSGTLIACARLIPAGISYKEASIGRIATSPDHRGLGIGQKLVTRSIEETQRLHPNEPIKIGAQQRLEPFYQTFGFVTVSEMYIEDDIPHIHMRLNPTE